MIGLMWQRIQKEFQLLSRESEAKHQKCNDMNILL